MVHEEPLRCVISQVALTRFSEKTVSFVKQEKYVDYAQV